MNSIYREPLIWYSYVKSVWKYYEYYLGGACVNSKSWLAIISKSDGADMLRRKTGCFTMGITVLASDTDFEAGTCKQAHANDFNKLKPTNVKKKHLTDKTFNRHKAETQLNNWRQTTKGGKNCMQNDSQWCAPGPGVPAGVLVRLLQCGAMVTCSSSSVRFIRLFTSAFVLASGMLLLRCTEFTSWKNRSLLFAHIKCHNHKLRYYRLFLKCGSVLSHLPQS